MFCLCSFIRFTARSINIEKELPNHISTQAFTFSAVLKISRCFVACSLAASTISFSSSIARYLSWDAEVLYSTDDLLRTIDLSSPPDEDISKYIFSTAQTFC